MTQIDETKFNTKKGYSKPFTLVYFTWATNNNSHLMHHEALPDFPRAPIGRLRTAIASNFRLLIWIFKSAIFSQRRYERKRIV
ncbi:MAG: hypothetical protein CL917_02475 [Deltaproteobacteria bacterium]|nr:hypothetical protein [Deltaproteobacteria bacterium]